MTTKEREMVRKPTLEDLNPERTTSLQPTYEDTVPPDPEEDWVLDD